MKYSPNEQALLKILTSRKGRPINTRDLVKVHYRGRDTPQYARQSVSTVINTLIKKTRMNREKFSIQKTPRKGPHPNSYWIS